MHNKERSSHSKPNTTPQAFWLAKPWHRQCMQTRDCVAPTDQGGKRDAGHTIHCLNQTAVQTAREHIKHLAVAWAPPSSVHCRSLEWCLKKLILVRPSYTPGEEYTFSQSDRQRRKHFRCSFVVSSMFFFVISSYLSNLTNSHHAHEAHNVKGGFVRLFQIALAKWSEIHEN